MTGAPRLAAAALLALGVPPARGERIGGPGEVGGAGRPSGIVDAAEFGVVCDGRADVAAALARAVEAAVPRPLYIPPQAGPCLLGAPFALKSNLVVHAQRGTVTFAPAPGNTGGLLGGKLVSNVTIQGLTFHGGGAAFPSGSPATVLYRVADIRFVDNDFVAIRGIAILCSNCSGLDVRGNTFSDIGNHWRVSGAAADRRAAIAICCADAGGRINRNNAVRDNVFTDVGLDAVSATSQTDYAATGNRCTWASLQNAPAVALKADAYNACIYVFDGDGVVVAGNISRGASGNAFDIVAKRYAITGNVATGSGQAGISANGDFGTITGNVLTNNVQWPGSTQKGGISLFRGQSVALAGNVASDDQAAKTQTYGIWGSAADSRAGMSIDRSNVLSGNAAGAFGGGIRAYGAQ